MKRRAANTLAGATVAQDREVLDRALADTLQPLSLGLMLLWLALSGGHLLVLSGHALAVMLPLSLATTLALGVLWTGLRRLRAWPLGLAHPLGALVALLLAANALAHIAVSGEVRQSTNVALLIVSIGCFFTSMRWLVAVVSVALVGWMLVVGRFSHQADWIHFAFMNLIALALAVLVLRNRARLIVSNHQAVQVQAEQAERLRQLSLTDPLTGLANRRAFDEALRTEWARSLRHGLPLAALAIDVDHFKHYNDTFGHQAGDRCLVDIAQVLNEAVRGMDTLSRYGGEEFVALLPQTDMDAAFSTAERLRASIEAARIPCAAAEPGGPDHVTVSIGVAATVAAAARDPEALISAADEALYRAKADGRNRSMRGQPSPAAAGRH